METSIGLMESVSKAISIIMSEKARESIYGRMVGSTLESIETI